MTSMTLKGCFDTNESATSGDKATDGLHRQGGHTTNHGPHGTREARRDSLEKFFDRLSRYMIDIDRY